MKIFAIFHLNLMFSSIPEEDRAKVIERCYWPLLNLIKKNNLPLGIEASGITLEIISKIDPSWIQNFKDLLEQGKTEFIGSGYGQIIGPLVPASVNKANLRIGISTSEQILGINPDIALVNEQAWSSGLVAHYLDAGYKGVFMDYDNPARFADWDHHIQHFPQRALGTAGESIPILWSRSVVFQKLQRFAHGEIELDEYLDYIDNMETDEGWLPVYGNDAEIFDFRPGRYKNEADFGGKSEWGHIKEAFCALRSKGNTLHLPSRVLKDLSHTFAGNELNLCTAQQPVPVKKQRKYNLTRWAVSGRNDFYINSLCRAVAARLERLPQSPSIDKKWRELCFCWSSDLRTHITSSRYIQAVQRLEILAKSCKAVLGVPHIKSMGETIKLENRLLKLKTENSEIVLNTAKGLAVQKASFAAHNWKPIFGTLEHGYFKDISLGADFFSGHMVMEGPGSPKETDLCNTKPKLFENREYISISCTVEIHHGHLEKEIRVYKDKERIDVLYKFEFKNRPQGYIRLGYVTLLTQNLNSENIFYDVANGGAKEHFPLTGKSFDHSNNVSFLVSSAHATGMTDSSLVIGEGEKALEITPLVKEHAFIAMITCRQADPTPFIRVAFSMQEMDETCMHNVCEGEQFNFSTGFCIKPYPKAGNL